MLIQLTFNTSHSYTVLKTKVENLYKVLDKSDAAIIERLLKYRVEGIKVIQSRVNNIDYYVEVI